MSKKPSAVPATITLPATPPSTDLGVSSYLTSFGTVLNTWITLAADALNNPVTAAKPVSSNITAPVSMTTKTAKNLTSISLDAGDWDVYGGIAFIPATTTIIADGYAGITTTSLAVALTDFSKTSFASRSAIPAFAEPTTFIPPPLRVLITATTTVYLVAYVTFTVSTCTAIGFLRARQYA